MKFTRALVTGGAGFIGSHLCDALLERGVSVRVIDDLSMGRRENVPAGADLIVGDVLDPVAMGAAADGMEAVFHLAARVSIRASTTAFLDDANVNLLGTLQMLKAAAEAGAGKVVFASSMAVYGEAVSSRQDEDHPLHPISPYGISKLAAEKYTLMMARILGFDALALRFFNTFGTRQTLTPYVGVMTIFINRLLAGKPPVIFGDGEQVRDFVYAGDVAEATVRAMECDASGEALNVGTGIGTSVNELARLISAKIDPSIRPDHGPEQLGETRHSVADVSRLERLTGFAPRTTIAERLDEVVEFIRTENQRRAR